MENINEILEQRGSAYGSYGLGIVFRMTVMRVIKKRYKRHHGKDMDPLFEQYFWDIINKLSRLAVTPWHLDSWMDIVGYSKLIIEDLKEQGYADQ